MYKHTGAKILFAMATGLSNVTFHIWVSHLGTRDYSVGENMAREYGIPVSERSLTVRLELTVRYYVTGCFQDSDDVRQLGFRVWIDWRCSQPAGPTNSLARC
jgi:hypothetical protein